MCVIFTVDAGANLTEDEISSAGLMNSDGWGIAWPEKQDNGETLVRWVKGLDTDQVFPMLKDGFKDITYVAHARMATAGGDGEELTHPFPVTSKAGLAIEGVAKRVLFHNGHWIEWEDTLTSIINVKTLEGRADEMPEGIWSDSRLLAYVLARYNEKAVLKAFQKAGKIAVLTQNEVLTYGHFTEVRKGIHASSMSWDWSGYETYGGTTVWSNGGGKTLYKCDGKTENGATTTTVPQIYDPLPTNILPGDIVILDSSRAKGVSDVYHGRCVRLIKRSLNFSKVESIEEGDKLEREWFPNKSVRLVTEDVAPLGPKMLLASDIDILNKESDAEDLGPIKVGHYIQYKRGMVDEDIPAEGIYGRVVRRYRMLNTGPMIYEIWNAKVRETHTVLAEEIVEHFANTKKLTSSKIVDIQVCQHGVSLHKSCVDCSKIVMDLMAGTSKDEECHECGGTAYHQNGCPKTEEKIFTLPQADGTAGN